jgi:TonB family protein
LGQNLTDGSVVVEFTVTDVGTVKDLFVRESDGAVFEDAAIAAVSEYLYEPVFENGVPVETSGVNPNVAKTERLIG